jgi:microcystin-dependent protein
MIKRLCLALAGLFALASVAQGAGTVPGFSLVPQFDLTGKIAPGCRLYVIQAGTVSTPQNAYQDSGLTLLQPNPMLCDASGRLPQWFVSDGNIKLRLTDKNGVQIFNQDGLLVVGASSGGGGGSPVDPTTILATGDIKVAYGTGILSGFVRANGRTIGSSTSGATERANADCQSLFVYLWGADANLAVSGGRGVSGAADWAANKTIALPDARGRVIAALDDMGNSAAGRLTSSYFGAGTTLGATGGAESVTLALAHIPIGINSSNASQAISVTSLSNVTQNAVYISYPNAGGGGTIVLNSGPINAPATSTGNNSISVTSTNTGGNPHRTVQPTLLATYYIKL